ncbi:MAG: DUF882 domain-containing protein [Magnetospirillum sp.]|nr:DUF882 domain-containing protein [Magnetospirillum sp.]
MTDPKTVPTRRGFLLFAGVAAASTLLPPSPSWANAKTASVPPPPRPAPRPATSAAGPAVGTRPAGTRSLRIQVVNTGERWEGVYWRDGVYVPEATRRLDALLRDFRAGKVAQMDPKLYDQLWELHTRLGSSEPWRVISAYRSPQTNAAARRTHRGVARNSFHIQAKALDVDLTDRSVRAIREAAIGLQAGGVGQYPRSDFVHIDTGPVRSWG